MLPIMAPRDEPQVTVRNVILERTITAIQNHQGRPKVNWFWKTQMFATRMMHVAPALLVSAKNILPTLTDLNTLNVYAYSDASLYGNTLQNELAIDDPADANAILAASRAACRYVGLTLTFDPTQVIPEGNMVEAAQLPAACQTRIYFRAP